jgi:hypothetical protein
MREVVLDTARSTGRFVILASWVVIPAFVIVALLTATSAESAPW